MNMLFTKHRVDQEYELGVFMTVYSVKININYNEIIDLSDDSLYLKRINAGGCYDSIS